MPPRTASSSAAPAGINVEEAAFQNMPQRDVPEIDMQNNFIQVKNDITGLIEEEMDRIRKDPERSHLLLDNKSNKKK